MRVEELTGYEVIEKREIQDLNSIGYRIKHKKTGAQVILLSNDDENKVFSIGFRTPPEDSTGVAHIIEHTVLNGSKEFPIKDPFIELAKGSLNTFLNAMTFPDKTLYPVASCNEKDFQNLMHVYLDAVFHPNIYKERKFFMQEGWHYEMENEEDELTINGVVYNEMKGALSAPEDVLDREVMNSLFPDTTYGYESGGDPENIPELTYEAYLEFHKKYYHPSNCYIYLYGDMDMAEKLDFIDRYYLSAYDRQDIDSEIHIQKPFDEMAVVEKPYSIGEEESEKENGYLAFNTVIGTSTDRELYVAFQILDYALCSAPGAPLKQALQDKGIGKDVTSLYENGIYQPFFSIIAKNVDVSKKEEFLSTIREVLQKVVKEGLNKKALAAGINYFEFKYREADFGSYPKGLMYGMQMMDSLLYDKAKPFIHIEANETYALLKEKAKGNYFEQLIQTYLLDNTHQSLVILYPKKGMTEEKEQQLKERLHAYKETLTPEEIRTIIEETKSLHLFQETPDKPEDLAKIPLLTRQDMKKEAAAYVNDLRMIDDTKFLFHPIFTNGIGYLRLMFDLKQVPEELFPYVGVFKSMLGLLDTEHYAYGDLFNEINLVTGGMGAVINTYTNIHDNDSYTITLELKARVLYENLEKAITLMKEIMLTSKFSNTKRVKEIIGEIKSRMQAQLMQAGHSVAVNRALSYFSPAAAINEQITGIAFYRLIEDLETNFEKEGMALTEKLQKLVHIIFRPENLMVDYISQEEGCGQLPDLVRKLKKELHTEPIEAGKYKPALQKKNEGFVTASQVQYVCRAGNFRKKGIPYHGSLRVLKVMMGYDYLWDLIRIKGGAYGCMCNFGKSGDCYFVSYRDPNLEKTVDAYEGAADYVQQFEADERTLTQYIIGAISELDVPMNPAAKGLYSLSGYMTGLTMDMVQRERDELLATDTAALQALSAHIRAFMEEDYFCVVGSSNKIHGAKEKFMKTERL